MSYPRGPQGSDPYQSGSPGHQQQPPGSYPDPAYGSQYNYPGYTPPPNPTQQLPPYWTQTQYGAGEQQQAPPPPPEPPKSTPRWLLFAALGAVLLVAGLVVALVIAGGGKKGNGDDTAMVPAGTPSTSTRATTTPPTTTRTTPRTTTRAPSSTPETTDESTDTSSPSGPPQTVTYSVTGEGKALTITYVDTGGVMQVAFNVSLPWSKEVSLAPGQASVTVVNLGSEVTCSLSVDGAEVSTQTGQGLTGCTGN